MCVCVCGGGGGSVCIGLLSSQRYMPAVTDGGDTEVAKHVSDIGNQRTRKIKPSL